MKTITINPLVKSHPFRQWLEWSLPNTDLTIEGYSRAGDKTFFWIPQLKICLDAALAEGRQGDYVLITHSHSDHIADIEYLASHDKVTIYAPKAMEGVLEDYITARRQLNHSGQYSKAKAGKTYTIVGVEAGERFEIQQKRSKYAIQMVHCDHAVPCVGYAFSEHKVRLKPAFEQLKQEMLQAGKQAEFGRLLGAKRKAGIAINESYWVPRLIYMGDTHIDAYANQEVLWQYPYIMTECTFLTPETKQKADQRRHTHWEDLRPLVLAHPSTTFVLIHFSLRHSDAEIIAFFEQEQQAYGFENVLLWTCEEPLLAQQGQSK